jgi:aminoglycoside phosphotransferase (APT) family kinase protein
MDFLRNILDLPVPRIFAYSTTNANPVGAEYIIMELLQGDSLASRWPSLSTAELKEVMSQISEVEQKISSSVFLHMK